MTDGLGEDIDGEGVDTLHDFEPVRADNQDNGEGSTAAIDFRRNQTGST